MFICISCNSWFDSIESLNQHRARKECAKIVIERAEAKKVVRAQQDAERKAKLEGPLVDEVKVKEPIIDAPVKVNKEVEVADVANDEIEIKVESAEVDITTTSEEVDEDIEVAVVDTEAFKQYLVAECDVKIQKISRLGEEKLLVNYAKFLPTFKESLIK